MQFLLMDIGRSALRFGIRQSDGTLTNFSRVRVPVEPYKAIRDYAAQNELDLSRSGIAAAVPGPFTNGVFRPKFEPLEIQQQPSKHYRPMNMPVTWQFSEEDFAAKLGVRKALLVHDMVAVALGLLTVPRDKIKLISGEDKDQRGPVVAIQTGIGLGLGALIPTPGGTWFPFSGEGGSELIAPQTRDEIRAFHSVRRLDPGGWRAPTAQNLLSVYSLPFFYERFGGTAPGVTSKYITDNADTCAICRRTLDVAAGFLGSFAANAALTFSAKGGVYLCGGLVAAMDEIALQIIAASFVNRGLAEEQLKAMKVYSVLYEYGTLHGLGTLVEKNERR